MKNHSGWWDLSNAEHVQKIVGLVFNKYFEADLKGLKEKGDIVSHNLCLRLRDFATVVEAEDAMRAGDIGRVMLMWKRWAIMAQGVKGMTHYSNHLPRLILLLEKDLPPHLAKAIRHSMLIPTSGRPDHYVSKDQFLELQNYQLKYFYNHSVSQTLSSLRTNM